MFRSPSWISFIFALAIIPLTSQAASENAERSATLASSSIIVPAGNDFSEPTPYDENLSSLIEYLQKEGFDIRALLKDPRFKIYDDIADRFTKSAERKSHTLDSYKSILGFEAKSRNIINFIESHSAQLSKAEETYGISKYVIAAILGIESDFGQVTGSYNPFNAYVSMYATNYRQDFAKAQLSELLKFTQRKDIDVFELKSSYAGAMAFAQFIPYSLNKWFVGNDIFDMTNNIMSVGNYLAYFKERTGNIETAVLRYNPSDMYTRAVLDLAQSAESNYPAAK